MSELRGKKIAILAETLYEDQELWYPYYRLIEAGAEVRVVGPRKAVFESKHGYPVKADCGIDEVKAADFDAVIIPGGYAPDHMRRNRAMVDLVREAVEQEKVVAAICHAGWMLASAGVLKGRKATSYIAIKDDMVHAGAEYLDQEVVRDGNLITSRFPADLPAFCRTIIAALK